MAAEDPESASRWTWSVTPSRPKPTPTRARFTARDRRRFFGFDIRDGSKNYSTPFVDGTPGLRGSISVAARSARASPLKIDSLT